MATDDRDDDFDRETTPPRAKGRYAMDDDARALSGAAAARARALTENERRKHAERFASGVPAVVVGPVTEDADTGPIAMLDSVELDDDDFRLVNRLRRDTPDPYTLVLKVVKLNRQLRHELVALQSEEKSNNEARANQLLELLSRPPHEDVSALQRQVAELRKQQATARKAAWWLIGALIGSLGGSVIYVVDKISSGAERTGAWGEQLREHDRALRAVEQDIRDIRREKDKSP